MMGHTPGNILLYSLVVLFTIHERDGRWRQVIRRCASVADTGVTGVCNWGVKLNGIYWEECYCSEDSCNEAPRLYTYWILLAAAVVIAFLSPFL